MLFSPKLIDHTLLRPEATSEQVTKLCQEARQYEFASVCVNPKFVAQAKQLLQGSPVKVCTVVGFPLGANTTAIKIAETLQALEDGAEEIDMVMDIGALKEKKYEEVKEQVMQIVQVASPAIVKVILETCLLSRDEIVLACKLCSEAKAHFVKTSTGFSFAGASVEDVKLMRQSVGPGVEVKASGGIKDLAMAENMLAAGATRLGMSASVIVTQDFQNHK